MMGLLVIKDKLKNIYAQNELAVRTIFKFLLIFIGMLLIKYNIGYMDKLKSIPIIFVISLLSAFLPTELVLIILAAVILANIYTLSMPIAVASVAILVVMFIAYYRFTPKDSILLIIIPMAFFLKIPYVIPLVVGLIGTPISIVSVVFGTIIYYIVHVISTNVATINNMTDDAFSSQIEYFMRILVDNSAMMLTIFVFMIVVMLVYYIKRMSINNAWTTAIIAGGIAQMVLFIGGSLVLKTDMSIVMVIIGTAISVLLAIVLQFFVFTVDYSRTEHTQFEDDEYYYYVKAVPKINVVAPEMNVKRINAQRKNKARR